MRNILTLFFIAATSVALSADWPMWGGTPCRNMVSSMKGLPTDVGRQDRQEREVGRRARLAVVRQSHGRQRRRDDRHQQRGWPAIRSSRGDRGVVMAFREATGEFLWQATFEKLSSGRANDWPYQGIASSPLIIDGIAYFTSNRGQIIAADVEGLPRQRERRPLQGREADRQERPRHHLDVRHDGRGRIVPAQPLQLLAGGRPEPALRAARRTARTKATSTSRRRRRRRSSRSTARPASWCGRTTRSAIASCTGSGRRRRSATSAA